MGVVFYVEPEKSKDGESIKQILRHNFKKDKKCFCYSYYEMNGTNGFRIREFWTNESAADLAKKGFKKADGFLDSIAYSGVSCYVKLEGFQEAIAGDQETAESLRNMLESDAVNGFQKGFAKTAMPELQMKQIAFLIPVAIGIILGVFLLFGGM